MLYYNYNLFKFNKYVQNIQTFTYIRIHRRLGALKGKLFRFKVLQNVHKSRKQHQSDKYYDKY